MVAKRIEVEPNSDLAQLLNQAREQPVVLEAGGELFRLGRESAPGDTSRDPQRVIQDMEDAQGVITPEEAEEWIQNIYRWRREGSRQSDEP